MTTQNRQPTGPPVLKPQPAPTPQPGWGGPFAAAKPAGSGMAVASLVMGIVSVVFGLIGLITGVIGLILGLKARRKLRGASASTGLATAGTITSGAGVLLQLLVTAVVIVVVKTVVIPRQHQAVCTSNLYSIGQATAVCYAQERYDVKVMPLGELVDRYGLGEPHELRCPGDSDWHSGRTSYFYFPHNIAEFDGPVACDFAGNHDKGRNVLFGDGSVRFMTEQEFQQLLLDPDNVAFADALRDAEASGDRSRLSLPVRPKGR